MPRENHVFPLRLDLYKFYNSPYDYIDIHVYPLTRWEIRRGASPRGSFRKIFSQIRICVPCSIRYFIKLTLSAPPGSLCSGYAPVKHLRTLDCTLQIYFVFDYYNYTWFFSHFYMVNINRSLFHNTSTERYSKMESEWSYMKFIYIDECNIELQEVT